jgi:hypothetical protein
VNALCSLAAPLAFSYSYKCPQLYCHCQCSGTSSRNCCPVLSVFSGDLFACHWTLVTVCAGCLFWLLSCCMFSARGSSSTPRDVEINNKAETELLKAELERLKQQVAQTSARRAGGLALPPVASGIDTRVIKTAGLCRRFMARLLDQLILLPISILICFLLPRPTIGYNLFGVEKMDFASALQTPLYQFVQFLTLASVRWKHSLPGLLHLCIFHCVP